MTIHSDVGFKGYPIEARGLFCRIDRVELCGKEFLGSSIPEHIAEQTVDAVVKETDLFDSVIGKTFNCDIQLCLYQIVSIGT